MKPLLKSITNNTTVPIQSIRHLIWQDEIHDIFILTREMEIYCYSDKILGLYIWNWNTKRKLRSKGLIYAEIPCDDGILACHADSSNLSDLLPSYCGVQRFPKNSKWIKGKEELLGHKILPFWIESTEKGEIPEYLKQYQFKKKNITEEETNGQTN